jgi:hypothetical protein
MKIMAAMHWTAPCLEPEAFIANHSFVVSLHPDTNPEVIHAEHKQLVANAVEMVRVLNRPLSVELISSVVDLPYWNVKRCLEELGILKTEVKTNGVRKERKKRDVHVVECDRVVKIILECLADGPKSASQLVTLTRKSTDYIQCQLRRKWGELWDRIRNPEKRPPKVTGWPNYLWKKL